MPLPPGGTIVNNIDDPYFPGDQSILTTYPIPYSAPGGGTVLNNSAIGHYLPKIALPTGWYEVDGYKEEWEKDRQRSFRYFKGPWSTLSAFKDYMLGYSQNFPAAGATLTTYGSLGPNPSPTPTPGSDPGYLSRSIPVQHPKHPCQYAQSLRLLRGEGAFVNDPFCFAQDNQGNLLGQPATLTADPSTGLPVLVDPTTGDPIGPNGPANWIPMIAYVQRTGLPAPNEWTDGVAHVEVMYSTVPYEVRTDDQAVSAGTELCRYVQREYIYELQAQQVPSAFTFTFTDGTPGNVPQNPIYLLPGMQLVYTWHEVPDLPLVAIGNCLGRVNNNSFDDGQVGFPSWPAGTLLMQPPKIHRYWATSGRWQWQITYRFSYKPNGWNSALAFTNGPPQEVGFHPFTPTIYQSADFNSLFTVPTPQF